MPAANVRPVHLDEPLKPERIPQHVVDMAVCRHRSVSPSRISASP
jgi:hypothetical protein